MRFDVITIYINELRPIFRNGRSKCLNINMLKDFGVKIIDGKVVSYKLVSTITLLEYNCGIMF